MNLSYTNDPFPHIIGELDQDLYNSVLENMNNVVHKNYSEVSGNRSNIPLENKELFSKISKIMMDCYDNFGLDYVKQYPKLLEVEGVSLKPRILYSENKPTDTEYKIRGLHLDTGDKFLIGLWYFKHPDEPDDTGGDLFLLNPETKKHKKIKYKSNCFVIFPNLMTAWHSVTPRKPCKFPRRYVNLLLESTDTTLHNYRRAGLSVDDEFRGKLINYYK